MKVLTAVALALTLSAPAMAQQPRKVGRALMTFYWIVDESAPRYHGAHSAVLTDVHGNVIARTTSRFKKDVVMEGAGWLRDGRTVEYIGRIRGERRFRVTNLKYGCSSTGCALSPYRTVAVDPRFVKLGSRIYVPQLKGAKLPDGSVHDGMFVAVDRGAFRGHHIDVFVGCGPRSSRPFVEKGYGSLSHVTVYVMAPTQVAGGLVAGGMK